MVVKVGINGFGPIGRSILHSSLKNSSIQVVTINDPFKGLDYTVDQFTSDSTHGQYKGSVSAGGNQLLVDGQTIPVYSARQPSMVPWGKFGVDYVVDTTTHATRDKTGVLLQGEAMKMVVISASSMDDDTLFFVDDAHVDSYKPPVYQLIYSGTTKTDGDTFGMVKEWITTVLDMMAAQKTVDDPSGKDWHIIHCWETNAIPTFSGGTNSAPMVIFKHDGKIAGVCFRVSDPDVSAVDHITRLEKPTFYDEIQAAIKELSKGDLPNSVVSTGFVGGPHSRIVDTNAGISLNPHFDKLNPWYDHDFGYSSTKTVNLISQIA